MTALYAGSRAFINTKTESTMFDKLDSVMLRYEDIQRELASPDIASNQSRFRKLMKEQSDLTPLVEAYGEYRDCQRAADDSLIMLEEESDEMYNTKYTG